MESHPLQQLRGIRLPAEPGWWPPAPGWWLLAALALAALAWGLWAVIVRWRRFAPARMARALCRDAYLQAQAQIISPTQYLNRINELLKRFAIHGIPDAAAKPLSGDPWLHYLDRRYGQAAFTRGAGRWLGAQRFRPGPDSADAAQPPAAALGSSHAAPARDAEAAPGPNMGSLAGSNIQMNGPQLADLHHLIRRFLARECSRFWKFWKSDRPEGAASPKPIAKDRQRSKAA